ncbi:MAG: hypothetical protein K940chlam9_01589 [Chlamydiae bacterium]|nr:hypothetical protein [Chlamydiota bacterium]
MPWSQEKPNTTLFLEKAQTLLVGTATFFSMLLFFFLRGRATKKKQHISGKKQIPATLLKIQLHLKRKASPIKIDPMPLLKGTETQHILVTGGTGTGKTNSFHHILPQIRFQKTILLDPTGLFVEKYFDPLPKTPFSTPLIQEQHPGTLGVSVQPPSTTTPLQRASSRKP